MGNAVGDAYDNAMCMGFFASSLAGAQHITHDGLCDRRRWRRNKSVGVCGTRERFVARTSTVREAEMEDTSDSRELGGGDRQADDALAARWLAEHWDAMVAMAGQRAPGGSATTPEDIAQEALLAAYGCRDRLEDFAGERAWLMAFVRNKAREAVRRRMRRGRKLPLAYADMGTDVDPVASDDRRERVLDAALGLPAKQREIVDLILDGCSDDEVAISTGLNKGTVWVYKHRAIRSLKASLRP